MAMVEEAYGGGYVVERRWYEMDGCALCVCLLCVCYLRGRRVDAQAHRRDAARREQSSAAPLSGRRCVCV